MRLKWIFFVLTLAFSSAAVACFSASLARRSFNFKENIATDLARLIRLCLTLDFLAANSAAVNPIKNDKYEVRRNLK